MPWFLTVVPAHILLSLGGLFQVRAIAILLERKFPRRYFYGVWLLVLSVYSYFVLTGTEVAIRIVLISNVYAFLAGSIGYLLLTDKHTPAKNRPYFFGGLYLLVALLLFIRSFYFIARLSQSDVPMFPGGGYAALLLAGIFLVASFPTMGFIALCSQIYQVRFFAKERELESSERRLRELVHSVDAVLWESDPVTLRSLFVTQSIEKILGYSIDEWLRVDAWRNAIHEDDRNRVLSFCEEAGRSNEESYTLEYRMRAKDGSIRWMHDTVIVVKKRGVPVLLRGVLLDTTQRKEREQRFEDLSFMYSLLSACRRSMAESTNIYVLFQDIVDHCTSTPGSSLDLVWIGIPDDEGVVRIQAAAGKAQPYLESLLLLTRENRIEGQGPTGRALREGKSIIVNFPEDGEGDFWAEKRRRFHLRSYASISFSISETQRACINLYSTKTEYFTPEYVGLFEQLAVDLGRAAERELIEDNRQQLQKALRENELVLGFALDSTVDAIWDFDLASKKPRFFRDWEKMLGYNAGELDGKELHWREILHGDEISDLKNLFASLIKGRTAQLEKTLRMKSKSGDFVWIKLRGLVVERDEDGMPQRLVGTLKNIDVDIRRIEEGRKNALLLDAVFESASVGLLVIHRSQKILKANRTIETLFALSMSADFVENLESLQFLSPVYPHEKQFAPPAAIARDVFESDKEGIVGFLLPHTLEERWLWMTTHYLEPMDAAVWFATDITELVEARDALQRMAIELEDKVLLRTAELTQVNHELEAFSYSLSHDIRAPITRAQNWVRNLEKGYSDALGEKGRQMLAFIQAEMEHLEAMNAAMLRLAHASQTPLRISEVNLSGMAEELLSELRLENPTQSIQASIEHDLVVTADGELLRLLLRNLLENSVKFSQKKTLCHIHVGKEINGNDTTFFISDNGEGFEMQYADKLFAPFQRLHSATEFPGLGVGLSIVLRIVHRHGGRIWVETQKGRGTAFYFTLPDAHR